MTANSKEFEIRELSDSDLDTVAKIEELSSKWHLSYNQLYKIKREKHSYGLVALVKNRVVGFVLVSGSNNHCHIKAIAVRKSHRKKGIGKKLIYAIQEKFKKSPLATIVRESNLIGQLFLKSCGLRAIVIMHNHFSDTQEDGYMMSLSAKSNKAKSLTL